MLLKSLLPTQKFHFLEKIHISRFDHNSTAVVAVGIILVVVVVVAVVVVVVIGIVVAFRSFSIWEHPVFDHKWAGLRCKISRD